MTHFTWADNVVHLHQLKSSLVWLFTLPKQENVIVRVLNPLGQKISSDRLENVTNNVINIDMSGRADGIYFIEVTNGNEKVTKKIIISH